MAEIDVPDLNLWVSLVDPDHQHHARARQYWEHESVEKIAFCRITMLGLLRLLTNARVMGGEPFTSEQAWDVYLTFAKLPEVFFIEDSMAAEKRFETWSRRDDFASHLWTDAWIASVAWSAGARVVSFDSDFATFSELRFHHLGGAAT